MPEELSSRSEEIPWTKTEWQRPQLFLEKITSKLSGLKDEDFTAENVNLMDVLQDITKLSGWMASHKGRSIPGWDDNAHFSLKDAESIARICVLFPDLSQQFCDAGGLKLFYFPQYLHFDSSEVKSTGGVFIQEAFDNCKWSILQQELSVTVDFKTIYKHEYARLFRLRSEDPVLDLNPLFEDMKLVLETKDVRFIKNYSIYLYYLACIERDINRHYNLDNQEEIEKLFRFTKCFDKPFELVDYLSRQPITFVDMPPAFMLIMLTTLAKTGKIISEKRFAQFFQTEFGEQMKVYGLDRKKEVDVGANFDVLYQNVEKVWQFDAFLKKHNVDKKDFTIFLSVFYADKSVLFSFYGIIDFLENKKFQFANPSRKLMIAGPEYFENREIVYDSLSFLPIFKENEIEIAEAIEIILGLPLSLPDRALRKQLLPSWVTDFCQKAFAKGLFDKRWGVTFNYLSWDDVRDSVENIIEKKANNDFQIMVYRELLPPIMFALYEIDLAEMWKAQGILLSKQQKIKNVNGMVSFEIQQILKKIAEFVALHFELDLEEAKEKMEISPYFYQIHNVEDKNTFVVHSSSVLQDVFKDDVNNLRRISFNKGISNNDYVKTGLDSFVMEIFNRCLMPFWNHKKWKEK